MARRRTRSGLERWVDSLWHEARKAARDRERQLRGGRAAAERQARALERLRKAEEREEALSSAEGEHRENEESIAAIRDLLRLAPARIRARSAFESGLAKAAFPSPERTESDRKRLDAEVQALLGRYAVPVPLSVHAIPLAGIALVAGGIALGIALRHVGGLALSGAGAILWGHGRSRARAMRDALRAKEDSRLRAEVGARIAAELERDRLEHERKEDERIRLLGDLLTGKGAVCEEAFRKAAESLDLPVEASAALAMAAPDVAEIAIDLHAQEEIPAQQSTLLKTGRISYRNRTKKDTREDDARAIASLCILYAAVALDELPSVESLLVSAYRPGVDPATGRDQDVCLASVFFERDPFLDLKLDRLDPIAALRLFDSRFSCTATFVLKPVEALNLAELVGEETEPDAQRPGGDPARERRSPEGNGGAAAQAARAAGPERGRRAEAAAGTSLELAEHALTLAIACARADGLLQGKELDVISEIIEIQFPLSPVDAKRLALRRAELTESEIRVEVPARALKARLSPLERQLFLERMFSVIRVDEKVTLAETKLFRSIAAALDVPPPWLDDLLGRWAPVASASASGVGAEGRQGDRIRWLSALELPRDAVIDRQAVERAANRIEDLYSESKFRLLAPQLREMAAQRLGMAREARAGLLKELPEPAESAAPAGGVRRENPDLDSIFG